MDFERLPVDAGGRFEDRFMDSLEPFDQSQILHVHARDLKTGASGSKELKIDRS